MDYKLELVIIPVTDVDASGPPMPLEGTDPGQLLDG